MKPTQNELCILKLLWKHGPKSAGEIHTSVSTDLNWSRSSTRKTIERMVQKDFLTLRDVHGMQVYSAKAKKIPTLAAMIKSFAADVLGLDGPLPVSNLVKSELLSPEELAELDALLHDQSQVTEADK